MHTYMHAYMHMHAYHLHAYMHTHAYHLHAYMHTYTEDSTTLEATVYLIADGGYASIGIAAPSVDRQNFLGLQQTSLAIDSRGFEYREGRALRRGVGFAELTAAAGVKAGAKAGTGLTVHTAAGTAEGEDPVGVKTGAGVKTEEEDPSILSQEPNTAPGIRAPTSGDLSQISSDLNQTVNGGFVNGCQHTPVLTTEQAARRPLTRQPQLIDEAARRPLTLSVREGVLTLSSGLHGEIWRIDSVPQGWCFAVGGAKGTLWELAWARRGGHNAEHDTEPASR